MKDFRFFNFTVKNLNKIPIYISKTQKGGLYMKIHKTGRQYLDTNIYKAKQEREKNINPKREKSVNIEISKSAKELVKKIEESKNEGFSQRVEKIRQSIINGTYNPSPEKIADKILNQIEEEKGSGK